VLAPWIVQATLSGVVLLVAVALYVGARVLRRKDEARWPSVWLVSLGLLIWVPPIVRDPGIALVLGAIAAIFPDGKGRKLVAALGVGVVVLLLADVVPGGASAIVLVPVVGMVGLVTHGELQHMLRLRRARALEPGQRPRGEVAVGGTVPRQSVPPLPFIRGEVAAWQMSWSPADSSEHPFDAIPTMLTVECEYGQVLVDLQTVPMRWETDQHAYIDEELAATVTRHLGFAPRRRTEPTAADDAPTASGGSLSWLVPGQEVLVVGVPKWEGGHGAAGYRDGTLVPVFRDGPDHGAWLAQHGQAEASTQAHWSVAQGLAWALVCALIATAQILGLA
jgi:hypothetical protein